jgi:uncharacterized protein YraI
MPSKKFCAVALGVAVIFFVAIFPTTADTGAKTTGTVNVRSGAGMIYGSVGSLREGTSVEIVAHEMSWYKINANGLSGYVSDKLVEITNPALKEKVSYVKSDYELLSSYTSFFETSVYKRNYNIEKSAYLCYREINPGERFSLNKNTGNSASAADGWQEATVISNGEYEIGIGGGICQTSSTIHSAVRQLKELTILERHPHSKPVGYVPVVNEAMVSYPSSDFRFRNDYDFPIVIFADVDHTKGSITAYVYKVNVQATAPEPINVYKDAVRLYSEELEKFRADNSLTLDVLGIEKENITNAEYNIGFAILDIDGDSLNDLLIKTRIEIIRPGLDEPFDLTAEPYETPNIEEPFDLNVEPYADPDTEKPVDLNVEPDIEKPVDLNIEPDIEKPVDLNEAPNIKEPVDLNAEPNIQEPIKLTGEPDIEEPIKLTGEPDIEETIDLTEPPQSDEPPNIFEEMNLGRPPRILEPPDLTETLDSIAASSLAETYNNIILYKYNESTRRLKLVRVLSSDFDGYEAYMDESLKWFEENYSDRTARQINKGFEYGEPVGEDYLKGRAKAIYEFNALTKENIDAYKDGALSAPIDLSPALAVNGSVIDYEVPPQNIDGRIYVEMRSLFESLGYNIEYNEATNAIIIFSETEAFYLNEGTESKTIRIERNGESSDAEIEIPIKLIADRTMFPIRFAGELLNYEVSWDQSKYVANLNGPIM